MTTFPKAFLFSASLSPFSSGLAGETSTVQELMDEAALKTVIEDSAKGTLVPPKETAFSGWRLSLSPSLSYQRLGKVKLNGGARYNGGTAPSLLGAGGELLPEIGPSDSFGDRSYNDGFVNQTGPTQATGRTWFWGYDSESQINNSGDLVMSANGTRSVFNETYTEFGGDSSDSLEGFTPRFDLNLTPPTASNFPFKSFLVSFAYFSDEVEGDFSSFIAEQTLDHYRLDFIDTYDTTGILLPGPGYGGTLAGPGVTIPNIPSHRESIATLTGTEFATLRNEVKLDLELDNFSLAIGPTFEGAFSQKWHWNASLGPTLNIYRYSMRQSEQMIGTIGGVETPFGPRLRESESGDEFGIGFFVRAGIAHQLTEEWKINGFLQTEIAESFRVSNGASSFKIDPSGYSIGLGVTRSF